MMDTEFLQKFGLGIAAVIAGVGGWLGLNRSSGKPPADRPVPPADVITQMEKYKRDLEQTIGEYFDNQEDRQKDRHREVLRSIDGMESRLRFDIAMKKPNNKD